MHNLDGVVCVLFTLELDETVGLMLVGDLVTGDVDIDDGSTLGEQLPQDVLVDLLVDVAGVDRGLLVAFVEGGNRSHALIINTAPII
jgi:hypothetical protein